MAIGFNIQFRVNPTTQSYVIRLTDTSTGFTLSKGNFVINYPDGSIRHYVDFNTPDISAPLGYVDVVAPTDTSGSVLTGSYTFNFITLDSSLTQRELVKTINFDWIAPTVTINNISDSALPEVKFQDVTAYTPSGSFTGVVTSRTFSVAMPSTSAVSGTTPSTSTAILDAVVSSNYYEGDYVPSLSTVITYTHTSISGLTVLLTSVTTKTFSIKKAPTRNELVTRINAFRAIIDGYKTKNDTQFQILTTQYDTLISLYFHLIERVYSSTLDGSQDILNEILNILNTYTSYTYQSGPISAFYIAPLGSGTVSSVDLSVPTGFAVSGNPVTTAGTLALAFASGYSLPSNTTQATWTAKQNALNGTGFVKSVAGVISYDNSTYLSSITSANVIAALGYTPYSSANPSNYVALGSLSSTATGLTYTNTTGVFSLTSGYVIPTTTSASNWDSAYTNRITSLTNTGTSGAASITSNVLNIPNYTLSGLGGQASSVNLTSLSALTYASTAFVKMTNSGTFSLDTNTYLTSASATSNYVPYSGANSSVTLGANNISANAFLAGYLNVSASASAITLTLASVPYYTVTGSGGQVFKLPNANTIPNGTQFYFNNNQSSGAIIVNNNSNTLVVSIPSGGYTVITLLDNTNAAGNWDRHDLSPSNVSWSTNTFDYAGSITSATWNGNVVQPNRGGTGQSTYTDGQLLIGNSSGNTLSKATLTAGTGITITNGNGSITISENSINGTINTIPKFTSSTAIGNSNITDTGSLVTLSSNSYVTGNLRVGTAADAGYKLDITGSLIFRSLSGASDTVLYVTTAGVVTQATIGSGLSFSGGTLSATGTASGSIGGSGTSGYIPKFSGTAAITNSNIQDSGSLITLGSNTTISSGSLGIGTTSLTGYVLNIAKNITGATTAYGIRSQGTVQSDVTTLVSNYGSLMNTAAASFTLTDFVHHRSMQGTIGSGSVVTNQYGYFADSSMIGATNNYGFYGNIASGSNRWNLYMNGTANNYIAGDTSIGTTSLGTATKFTLGGSETASSAIARGQLLNTTLVASANSDVLVGLDIAPTFTNGSFTSVQNIGLRLINLLNSPSADATRPSPQLLFSGSQWNSFLGATRMTAAMQVESYQQNSNPTIGKLSFFVGTDNAIPVERMNINSDGLLSTTGGANFIAGTGSYFNDITLTQNSAATTAVPVSSNRLVLKGTAWNSSVGSKPNMGYLQMINIGNNSNPTFDKLSFFVGSASSSNTGNVVGNATERLALRTDGIFSFFNSSTTETLRLFNTGNLTLQNGGTFTDAGYRLDVNGTTRLQGDTVISSGGLGIGTISLSGNNLVIAKNLTGTTDANSIFNNVVIQSDVVNTAVGFRSTISTQGVSSYNLNVLSHFFVSQGTVGTGSSVNTQIGYWVNSNIIGATSNYGFRGSIPNGTNRWNIYMDGTADNYMAGSLAIGATSNLLSINNLWVAKSMTGGIIVNNITSNGTIQPDVTSAARYYATIVTTAATTAISNIYHFFADQGTLGAGSTVTNQYGFSVNSSLIGATNNYAFSSNLSSGSGRWNLYMAGTAQNYLAGALSIGVSTANASALLQVDSTTQGVLFPRMTTTQKNAISSPATGLVVFDTTLGKLCVYSTTWQTITSL
jgi:hypothetical protein